MKAFIEYLQKFINSWIYYFQELWMMCSIKIFQTNILFVIEKKFILETLRQYDMDWNRIAYST